MARQDNRAEFEIVEKLLIDQISKIIEKTYF